MQYGASFHDYDDLSSNQNDSGIGQIKEFDSWYLGTNCSDGASYGDAVEWDSSRKDALVNGTGKSTSL